MQKNRNRVDEVEEKSSLGLVSIEAKQREIQRSTPDLGYNTLLSSFTSADIMSSPAISGECLLAVEPLANYYNCHSRKSRQLVHMPEANEEEDESKDESIRETDGQLDSQNIFLLYDRRIVCCLSRCLSSLVLNRMGNKILVDSRRIR